MPLSTVVWQNCDKWTIASIEYFDYSKTARQRSNTKTNGNLFKTFVHNFNYIRNIDAYACATTAEQIFALMEFNVSFSVFGLHLRIYIESIT